MRSTQTEIQKRFRTKRKVQGGARIDTWLPPEEAYKLKKISKWRGQSRPQVILSLIESAWRKEVENATQSEHADALFEMGKLEVQKIRNENELTDEVKGFFQKSAEKGIVAAQHNLGVILSLEGKDKSAAKCFQRSAKKEIVVSQYNLGVLFVRGKGVKQNFSTAAKYFKESANREFKPAFVYLGLLQSLGKGLEKNNYKAIELIQKGIGKSRKESQHFLADILATDSFDQIRNGSIAIILAEELVKKEASISYLNTLAAAYAEADKFEEALQTQRKSIVKLKRNRPPNFQKELEICEKRLENYIRAKPWRENNRFTSLYWCLDNLSD